MHLYLLDGTAWRPLTPSDLGGGGGASADREIVVSTYRCKTAFTGASIGDTITATQVIDVSDTPSTVSTIWRNQTTAADLGGAPSAANLELTGSTALTDAQFAARDPATQTTLAALLAAATSPDPAIGVPTGTAVDTDADGTLQQYARGVAKNIGAKTTASALSAGGSGFLGWLSDCVTQLKALSGLIGVKAASASLSVVGATVSAATISRVASSASSVQLLASNASRTRVIVHNESTAVLRMKFGTTASATDYTYLLNPGETFESPVMPVYTGRIDGIWAAANGAAQITEM